MAAKQANTNRVLDRVEQQQNAPAEQQQKAGGGNKFKELYTTLQKSSKELAKALPQNTIAAERMIRGTMTAVRNNPSLIDCDKNSLMAAAFNAAQLGLSPDLLGSCYFIPFNDKNSGTKQVQLIIGYKGYIDLVSRSGNVIKIEAREVRENDLFDASHGTGEHDFIQHKKARGNRGEITDFYCIVTFRDGSKLFETMSAEEIIELRDEAGKSNSQVWRKHFAAMGRKTVIRQLVKYLPISTEVQANLAYDETIQKDFNSEPERIDITDEVDNNAAS